ncbi:MAG: VC0807 family protein [Vulcanimicrobiota bacterium]
MSQPQPPGRKEIIIDLLVNGLGPWLGYLLLVNQLGWTEFHGLLAVTVIPGVWALVGLVRKGKLDPVATISLVAILISLAMTAATSDTRLLQLRESYLTGFIGLIFFVSCLLRRPVLLWLARAQATQPEQVRMMDHPEVKRRLTLITWVWGVTFVVEFALKVWMVYTLDIATVLALGPVMVYGVTGICAAWTVWYVRRGRARQESNSPPT